MNLGLPPLQVAFNTTNLNIFDWFIVFLVSASVLLVTESYKAILSYRTAKKREKIAEKIAKSEI